MGKIIPFDGNSIPPPSDDKVPYAPVRCRLHLHKWRTWKTVKYGELVHQGNCVGYYTTQLRICALCNKHELRREESLA